MVDWTQNGLVIPHFHLQYTNDEFLFDVDSVLNSRINFMELVFEF